MQTIQRSAARPTKTERIVGYKQMLWLHPKASRLLLDLDLLDLDLLLVPS